MPHIVVANINIEIDLIFTWYVTNKGASLWDRFIKHTFHV